MKRFLQKGLLTFEVECGYGLQIGDCCLRFTDFEDAHTFLMGFMGDYYNMAILRGLVGEATSTPPCYMDDHQVISHIARLISGKRIYLKAPPGSGVWSSLGTGPGSRQAGGRFESPFGSSDDTSGSGHSPSQPSRPDVQPPETQRKIPNINVQVDAFIQASESGTPFCEVCAEL